MKQFNGVWIPCYILTDKKLSDKEKIVYSMIICLSKTQKCTMSNSYISELLNISKVQASRIVNSLKKKGYIKTEFRYKENSKEIAVRESMPINKNDNTYKQMSLLPINKNVKEIININKIYNNKGKQKIGRIYSKEYLEKLYVNNF